MARWDQFHRKAVPVADHLKVALRAEPSDRPSYFPTLDLDQLGMQLPAIVWGARAAALEKDKDFVGAAHAYEHVAAPYQRYLRQLGKEALNSAARCYDSAGMGGEAARDRALAKEVSIR